MLIAKQAARSGSTKLFSVQYLRGIASFFVVVSHSFNMTFGFDNFDAVRLGRLGVFLFFVISGFIIVTISGDGSFSATSFMRRRIVRVVPLYWLTTTAIAIIAIAAPQLLKTTVFGASHFLLSLFFIPHYDPVGKLDPILKLGWTLNYEMFFYICFAALAFLNDARLRVLLITILFAILSLLGVFVDSSNALFHTYANYVTLAFCAGAWIGLATIRGYAMPGSGRLGLIGLLLVCAIGIGGGFWIDRSVRGTLLSNLPFILGSAALLMIGLARERQLPRWALLEKLGDSSYSLYLVHLYWIGAVVAVARHFLHGRMSIFVCLPFCILGACLVGYGFYLFLEKPLLIALQRPARRKPATAMATAIPIPVDGVPPGTIS